MNVVPTQSHFVSRNQSKSFKSYRGYYIQNVLVNLLDPPLIFRGHETISGNYLTPLKFVRKRDMSSSKVDYSQTRSCVYFINGLMNSFMGY